MAGPVSITCPTCREAFTVPTEVLGIDGHQVVVRMDRSELHGHLQACAARAAEQQTVPGKAVEHVNPPQPVHVPSLLPVPPFVARGRRPCVLCGAPNPECLTSVQRTRSGCCAGCDNGATHPAPHDTLPCAVWATDPK